MFLLKIASEIGWFYTPNLIRPMKKNIPTWLTIVDPIEKKNTKNRKIPQSDFHQGFKALERRKLKNTPSGVYIDI